MMILLSIPELLLSILKFLTNRTPYRILPITIIITLFCCFLSSAQDEQSYDNCKHQFECGDPSVLGELKYPFWGINRESYCGQPGFELTCINNIPVITNSTYNLEVIGTDPQHNKMTVSMADFSNSLCPSTVVSRQLTNLSIFELFSDNFCIDTSNNYRILTILYGCPSELGHHLSWSSEDPCSTNASVNVHFVTDTVNSSISSKCLYVAVLPILQQNVQHLDDNPSSLADVLDQGFEMKWTTQQDKECQSCMESGGECGFRWDVLNFTCYCPDKTKSMICSQPTQGGIHKSNTPLLITIGVTIGGVALLSLLGGYLLIFQKFKPNLQNQNVEDSLKIYASLVPKRYTYRSIKKITKSFREKLGEGGFGIVFKGNLEDGRAVAVKLWKQSKGDGQDFINEVMSMSRTSHVNVVPLFGFCFEGHKRALIYDFMPNGSLEKFIQVRYTNENNQKLCAQKLFEIAIGIARGLEYLHRGCNPRIVHFDIKPHNILLDEEFIPKISDFGLAKSCPQKASIISMSGARGTAGYIAPEVFFRMYGGVSHKSDVYSFGMMVLEMVGCKNKVNDNAQNSSEMYFPDWIYKQLEQGTSVLNCEIILNEEDKGLERKMILVGLSCIQTNPMSRPSMSRVVEMLEGKVELLEVPPMPTLASPPKLHQSTNTFSSSFHS